MEVSLLDNLPASPDVDPSGIAPQARRPCNDAQRRISTSGPVPATMREGTASYPDKEVARAW